MVIGLGNPGDEYSNTRHNVGQDVVELLARRHGVALKRAMGKAYWGQTRVGDKLLALGLPGTYMNLSGEGTAPLVRRYGIKDLSSLLIVHDELDLPVGKMQFKLGGGLAGHNGLKSIKHYLKTDEFARLRIGIDRPPGQQQVSDYVLKRFGSTDRKEIDVTIEEAADAIELMCAQGITYAMNQYN